ncbi:MAG: hypothetical protein HSCHL_1001 [Hydrogenibacillus schlegelii]|uniref:Uncharacterized protein n=1 Tax=Hydrogenibacillus schlegelii TaxID=1484 RepID=A0A2T5G6U0_HYDSH|nr:MAG: hypothetical protein HSCHL_1001 [Hydrogenibacillus schlegelii]
MRSMSRRSVAAFLFALRYPHPVFRCLQASGTPGEIAAFGRGLPESLDRAAGRRVKTRMGESRAPGPIPRA